MCGGFVKRVAPIAASLAGGYLGGPYGYAAVGAGLGAAGGTLATGGDLGQAALSGLTAGVGTYVGSQLFPDFSLGPFFEGTPSPGMAGLPGAEGVTSMGGAAGAGPSAASTAGGFWSDPIGGVGDFFTDLTAPTQALPWSSGVTTEALAPVAGAQAAPWASGVTTEALAPIAGTSGVVTEALAPAGMDAYTAGLYNTEAAAMGLESNLAAGAAGGPTVPIPTEYNPAWVNQQIGGFDPSAGMNQTAGVPPGTVQPLPSPGTPQLGTGAPAPPSGVVNDILASLGVDTSSGIGKFIARNPGSIAAALGLGYAAMQPEPESMGELRDLARQTAGQGQILTNYLQSGTLPPGAQESVDEGKRAAIAAVRSKYSSLGLSGSTMEMDALQAIETRAETQAFSFAAQLLDAGLRSTGLSSNIYNYLINAEQTDDQAFAQALGAFTSTLAPNPAGA